MFGDVTIYLAFLLRARKYHTYPIRRHSNYPSPQLSKQHREITLPLFSEVMGRLQNCSSCAQKTLLQILGPWLSKYKFLSITVEFKVDVYLLLGKDCTCNTLLINLLVIKS